MYFEDFQAYDYKHSFTFDGVVMIGWLDAEHGFARGQVPELILTKMYRMISRRTPSFDLHVNVIRGVHPCNLCGEKISFRYPDERPGFLGMSEIWVPTPSIWYAAPSLIVHYVETHAYLPPDSFLDAVRDLDEAATVISQSRYDDAIRDASAQKR